MSQKHPKEPPPSGPPSIEELKAAINGAGYPFELRIFKKLRALGAKPTLGIRMREDDGPETREIDIRDTNILPMEGVTVSRFVLFQVKRVPAGTFVGFLGEPPSKRTLRSLRARCGGLPSCSAVTGIGSPHAELMRSDEGLGPAFDPINQAPFCVQWCVAQRSPKDPYVVLADHPARIWTDIATLVKVKARAIRDETLLTLQETESTGPDVSLMEFWSPTLVVDAPLYTHSADDDVLTPVDRLTITIQVDTTDGVVEDYVDVVTFDGIDALVAAHRAVAEKLEALMPGHIATALLSAAMRQYEEWKEAERQRFANAGFFTSPQTSHEVG